MSDVQSMTYAELAAALGIGADSARNLVRRRRWHRTAGNDGMARIAVPVDYLDRASHDPGSPPADAPADGGADPPIAELATSLLIRHISRLETEIETLKQERDRARDKASDRDAIAAQLRALKAELYELRDDRGHWRHLAERLALAQPAPRRWRWPWSRTADRRVAAVAGLGDDRVMRSGRDADRDAEHPRAASGDSLLGENASADAGGPAEDQFGSLVDGAAADISTSGLERALERLARETELRQRPQRPDGASEAVARRRQAAASASSVGSAR